MIGILLIHGFSGGRREVLSLGLALKEAGYEVLMPVLSGHESDYFTMAKHGYKDWLDCVENSYKTLADKVDKVVVVGFSMGGLLGINLAQKFDFESLITINTPVYHWNFHQVIKNLRERFFESCKKYIKASIITPTNSFLEFKILLNKTIPLIRRIKCPMMVIQVIDDDTANPKSIKYFEGVLGNNCRIETMEHGGHVILCSPYRDEVITLVKNYLNEQL